MKSKLILCLALVLSVGLCGYFAAAQSSAKPDQWPSILPPITNANPSIRLPLLVHVPTKLKIERTTDMLSVDIDTNSFEPKILTVGTNMVTGFQSEWYVYPAGEAKPATRDRVGLSGLEGVVGGGYWYAKKEGIPLPGKTYIVELDLTVFETDIPPGHMWMPQDGKNYKVLWQRTLKQTVE